MTPRATYPARAKPSNSGVSVKDSAALSAESAVLSAELAVLSAESAVLPAALDAFMRPSFPAWRELHLRSARRSRRRARRRLGRRALDRLGEVHAPAAEGDRGEREPRPAEHDAR